LASCSSASPDSGSASREHRQASASAEASSRRAPLDLERFTMFKYSRTEQRLEELVEYVRAAERKGRPLLEDPLVR